MEGGQTDYTLTPCDLPGCSAEDALIDDDGDWVCRVCHESRLLDEEDMTDPKPAKTVTHEIEREAEHRLAGYWLQEHDYLSPNARSILRYIKSPRFQAVESFVRILDAGDAKEDAAEHDLLYDNIGEITDTVVDLYNMVRRRDERIAALEEALSNRVHASAVEKSIATGRGD